MISTILLYVKGKTMHAVKRSMVFRVKRKGDINRQNTEDFQASETILQNIIVETYHYEVKSLSRVRLFVTPWTVAYQAPPSMGFSRQEYWSGVPFPSPGDLPKPGIKPSSPAFQLDALTSEPPGKPYISLYLVKNHRIDIKSEPPNANYYC